MALIGVGKTRLAIAAGACTLDNYPDGVWLVARLLPDSVDEGERLLRRANTLVRPFGTSKKLGALPDRARLLAAFRGRPAAGALAA